jgi:hypothetical protein
MLDRYEVHVLIERDHLSKVISSHVLRLGVWTSKSQYFTQSVNLREI